MSRLQHIGIALLSVLIATNSQSAQLNGGAAQNVRSTKPAVRPRSPVTLNFVSADVEAVTRAIGVMMDRQIIIDPRVKGTITVYSEQPVSIAEGYRIYLAAMRGIGFTVVESGGFLKVLPEPEAKLQADNVAIEGSGIRGDQIVTQIFVLQHEIANNLLAVLRPLITPNNSINANPGNNSLVVTDYADNLQRIAKIISAMDVPGAADIEIVPLKHSVAADLAPLVQRLADGGAAAGGGAPGQANSAVNVLVDARSNGLILRASNPTRLAAARAIVDQLDQPTSGNGNEAHVVFLKNADAVKLAAVLRAAFGASSSATGAGSAIGGGTPTGPGNNFGIAGSPAGNGAGTGAGASGVGASSASTAPLSASAGPSTGGFVQADPSTNSLIITAAEPLYRQVRAAIEQLDVRRAQVYVESLVVKIDNAKAARFGVQWQNLFGDKGDSRITGVGTNFGTSLANIINGTAAVAGGRSGVAAALQNNRSAPTGLNVGVLKKVGDFYTLGAVANLFEGQGGANVMSTPNLVVLDNEEARIVIGQNVPFVTGSYAGAGASTGGTVNPFQTVDRKDVGLTLKVKVQIGAGNTVRLQVYQENSNVVPGSSGTEGPTLDKSAIEASVAVDDGDIIVLGGLLKDEYIDGDDGVPGLSKIPLIGRLFSSENRSRVKTNLMVFLRPVVMRTADDGRRLSLDRYESIRALQQQSQPRSDLLLPDTGAPIVPVPTQPAASGGTAH
ncbi:type II secretion system secretin GspD [Roseateles sp. NT4]|uniref:type II secretion system secretin GspD n=1 Tax=Roseateles sp. NT4 TaxID=3453715 RepID=UPI003EEB20FE